MAKQTQKKKVKPLPDPTTALFNRPKGEKSHSWMTVLWVIVIALGLIITFTVLYYVLIAPIKTHIDQQNNGATSPQSSLPPHQLNNTNPTYEVGFFLLELLHFPTSTSEV